MTESPILREMRQRVIDARLRFIADVEGMVRDSDRPEVRNFAHALSNAVGEISVEEARAGLERFIAELPPAG